MTSVRRTVQAPTQLPRSTLPTHAVGQQMPIAALALEMGVSVEELKRLNPRLEDTVPAGTQVNVPERAQAAAEAPRMAQEAPPAVVEEREPADPLTQATSRFLAAKDPQTLDLERNLHAKVTTSRAKE